MQITRLRLTNFRGWEFLDLQPRGHAVLIGEPRAGRSDVIAALTRILDPHSTRKQPTIHDIHQMTSAGSTVLADCATAEVTLTDLPGEVELDADGMLEPLLETGLVDETGTPDPTAPLGLRMAYRVSYDPQMDVLEHVVYFPVASNPSTGRYTRVPKTVREALPVVLLNSSRPMQLRSEGLLRRLIVEHDALAATATLKSLEEAVAEATSEMSKAPVIRAILNAVLDQQGPARRIADTALDASDVRFLPEDGSLAGLLRSIQPVLRLDDSGPLPLASHGSSTSAALAAAEALLLCMALPDAVVIGDDVGENLDGATTEHLTGALRRVSHQVWFATRRADGVRSFETKEIVRLTRHTGTRLVHQVPTPADRKEASTQRHIRAQLLPALTATVVTICEGPHDLSTFSAADRRRLSEGLPLAAHGTNLISADSGSGGGTTQIPPVAKLAKQLGYRVIALVDGDPAKYASATLDQIENACDTLIQLPNSMAIERAILAGSKTVDMRRAASVFPRFGQPDPTLNKTDDTVETAIMKQLHKKGLHEQFLDALIQETGGMPPIMRAVLDVVSQCASSTYSGPKKICLTDPTTNS